MPRPDCAPQHALPKVVCDLESASSSDASAVRMNPTKLQHRVHLDHHQDPQRAAPRTPFQGSNLTQADRELL